MERIGPSLHSYLIIPSLPGHHKNSSLQSWQDSLYTQIIVEKKCK